MKESSQRGRGVYACLTAVAVLGVLGGIRPVGLLAQDTAPGGFVEHSSAPTARPPLTRLEIEALLPSRGRFQFPAPYLTEGARITNASDCAGGGDCIRGVGYSYWRNMNNHVGSDRILIVLGLDRLKGGGGPTLFSYQKATGETRNLGPLFDPASNHSWATGEGWYFSATHPTMLYMNDGAKMLRYDVVSRTLSTVFDASSFFGPNRYIWQMHSSANDRVHSFTLRDSSSYAMLGCGAYLEDTRSFRFFQATAGFDECQVDKTGRFVVIKQDVDGRYGEDNVIEDLLTGTRQVLLDQDGAAGHSDTGFGYQVAEDNFHSLPGAVRVWTFGAAPTEPSQGRLVFHATDWAFGSNHIAHANSRPGASLSQQVACSSNANRQNLPRANEVLCYRLDGSLSTLVVAPVMTDLDAPGGGEEYWKLPKGNLDVTGEYFLWTTNLGGSRLDAVIVRVPLAKLGGDAGSGTQPSTPAPVPPPPAPAPPPPAPAPAPDTSLTVAPVTWTSLSNAVVEGEALRKQGGCDGCPDAGALSAQQIASGDGYVEFSTTDTKPLRVIGLDPGSQKAAAEQIDFAIRVQNGRAEVRESGIYRSDTGVKPGEVLRIQAAGGRVRYLKNGTPFYESGMTAATPLLVHAVLYGAGASIDRATIAAAGGTPTSAAPPPSGAQGGASAVVWTNLNNAQMVDGGLKKTGGCNGCADAGAISEQTFAGSDATVEFVVTPGFYFVGLDSAPVPRAGTQMLFALRLNQGVAEVRERGAYRAEIRVSTGDRLRISIAGGKIQYAKSGVVFWTSPTTPAFPLRVSASLYESNVVVNTPALSSP